MLVFDQWSSHPSLGAQTHLSLSSWTRDASAENNNRHLWPLFTAYAIQSGLHQVPPFQFNAMLSWALINKDESPYGRPMKILLRKWKFQILILFNRGGVDFFHLHLTLKIRPLADLDSHTYLHSWTLSSRNGRLLINVSSTNFYRAHSLFDFKTSQKLEMMSSVTLWLSIIAELISANH